MKQFEITARIRNNLLKERRGARTAGALCAEIGCEYGEYVALETMSRSPIATDWRAVWRDRICMLCDQPARHRDWPTRELRCEAHVDTSMSAEERADWIARQPKRWRRIALQIAEFYGVSPSVLFPDDVLQIACNSVTVKANAVDVHQLHRDAALALMGEVECPADAAERSELARDLNVALETLSERERTMLTAHFGIGQSAKTLKETGDEHGVGPERVRQITRRALWKLRHPSRAVHLKEHA